MEHIIQLNYLLLRDEHSKYITNNTVSIEKKINYVHITKYKQRIIMSKFAFCKLGRLF